MIKIPILFFLILFSFSQAQASLCAQNLSSQKLLERVEAKAFVRYFRKEEVYLLAEEMSFLEVNSSEPLNLQLKGISFTFNKKLDGDTLTYMVPRAELIRKDQKLSTGQRPKGLSTGFSKLTATLFLAAEQDLKKYPEVTRFRIIAGSVVNKGLITLFEKSGFKQEPPPSNPLHSHRRYYDHDFGPRMPFRIDPALEFMNNSFPLQYDETLPRTWSVSFQITSRGRTK